jgi:3-oxoacyl-[acyl-carrier protein] reductase
MVLFAATKAAMEALTRSWADLFRTHANTAGTTVNSLIVGATATEALLHNAPDHLQRQATQILQSTEPRLGTMGHVDDVAHVAGLLVRQDAGWITGSAICANGGSCKIL